MNALKALQDHGQAVWLDFLSRGFIAKGGLKKLVDEDGLRGVTSNPSIFEQAIGNSDEYDDAIAGMLAEHDRPAGELFEQLAIEDIQKATDVLRPVFEATHGRGRLCQHRSVALSRDRHRRHHRRGEAPVGRDRPQEPHDQGAGDAGRIAG